MPYGYSYQQPFYGNQVMNPSMAPLGQQQPGALYARYVSCREEAVAAYVNPDGRPNLFVNSNTGYIYSKAVDPNGIQDFRDYAHVPPQPKLPEGHGVTIEMFNQLRGEVEGLKAAMRPMEVTSE